MWLGIFVAICIIGVDFLIYALFQWTYGDRRAALRKKVALQREAMRTEKPRLLLLSSRKAGPETRARLQKVRERMTQGKTGKAGEPGRYQELFA